MQVNNATNVAQLYGAAPTNPVTTTEATAKPSQQNTADTVTLSDAALTKFATENTVPGSGWGNEPPVKTLNTAQADTAPGSGWGNEPPIKPLSESQADTTPGSGWGNEPPIKG